MAASERRLLGSRWASAALIHHGANSLFCRRFDVESEGWWGEVLEAKKREGGMSIEERVASQIKLSCGGGRELVM